MDDAEVTFNEVTRSGIAECIGLNYRPRYWMEMVTLYGAVNAATRLLTTEGQWQSGFTRLFDMQRLDLSVEYMVLDPRFRTLFTDAEVLIARDRLAQVGYPVRV
jgi:hypothetical protein